MFFERRPVQPAILPLVSPVAQDEELKGQLEDAVAKHKAASNYVIQSSLDAVDRSEQTRMVLDAVMARAAFPELRTAQGAFELITRGHPDVNHSTIP